MNERFRGHHGTPGVAASLRAHVHVRDTVLIAAEGMAAIQHRGVDVDKALK